MSFFIRKVTGITLVISIVKNLCRALDKWYPQIRSWIEASTLTAEQKNTLLLWLNGANAACTLIELIPDD